MSDAEGSLEAKRVYAETGETTTLFVASGAGLARVSVSGDLVGEFTLEHRGPARDVATADGRLAVATPEDVLVGVDGTLEATDFGPAAAVTFHDGIVAAGDGRVARYDRDAGRWSTLGDLEGVEAMDGDLVAAASGVHRLDGSHVGLERARDVATRGRPLAATEAGLYYLANGWMTALEGSFQTVARGPGGLAHAATAAELYERAPPDGQWTALDLPAEEPVADVAAAGRPDEDGPVSRYVVTEPGTVLVDAGDGWRSRSLGLPDVASVAVLYG